MPGDLPGQERPLRRLTEQTTIGGLSAFGCPQCTRKFHISLSAPLTLMTVAEIRAEAAERIRASDN